MKIFTVNIENKTLTVNNETCNFYEAGLTNNSDPVQVLTDAVEIKEVLTEQNDGEEIEINFI